LREEDDGPRYAARWAGAHISIHVLREEDDTPPERPFGGWKHFYPRPPRGGRPKRYFSGARGKYFLSTSSARRTTADGSYVINIYIISIHVLREEDDSAHSSVSPSLWLFLSTSSARRTTWFGPHGLSSGRFLSTSSARRTTPLCGAGVDPYRISIHVLREE